MDKTYEEMLILFGKLMNSKRQVKDWSWFVCDVMAAMLVVCKGEEQKHFSSLGTKPHFYVNSSRKNYIIVLTTNTPPTWPPCHVVASQKLLRYASMITEQTKCWELLVQKFDPFQTLCNNSQQHATTCNRLCKRPQHVTSNNVASVWRGFKKLYQGSLTTSSKRCLSTNSR